MFGFFKKEPDKNGKKDNITVLKKTAPNICGGTDAYIDNTYPKKIKSDKMVMFDVYSSEYIPMVSMTGAKTEHCPEFTAFAVCAGEFSYILFSKQSRVNPDESKRRWAYTEYDIFSDLTELVRKYDIAKDNGFHSQTHGLPRNFGGSIVARFDDGEKISISNNQSPIFTSTVASAIIAVFENALKQEKIELPDVSGIRKIRFTSERASASVNAELTILDDGTGINVKDSDYGQNGKYHSEKAVDAETVGNIKKNVENCGMFGWEKLPERHATLGGENKSLMITLDDGREITVPENRELPFEISRGFFNIELELVTKN